METIYDYWKFFTFIIEDISIYHFVKCIYSFIYWANIYVISKLWLMCTSEIHSDQWKYAFICKQLIKLARVSMRRLARVSFSMPFLAYGTHPLGRRLRGLRLVKICKNIWSKCKSYCDGDCAASSSGKC